MFSPSCYSFYDILFTSILKSLKHTLDIIIGYTEGLTKVLTFYQIIPTIHTPCVLHTIPTSDTMLLLKQALKHIEKLENTIKSLCNQVDDLDVEIHNLNQYGRRDSIEIVGIFESVLPQNLERYVIHLLSKIKVTVTESK